MSELETYSVGTIANLMYERSHASTTLPDVDLDYLDVHDKVGKEVFGPLADEGVHVVAVMPRENGVRVWFEEDSE